MAELAWVFYTSLAVAFVFAFGIGANDVANSFGTSIGSGALTLRRAVMVAAVCEIAGATTLGAGVSDTIVRQISLLDSASCWDCGGPHSRMRLFMLGMACALMAGALFMLAATYWGMPVSTTHAIVGAVLGMTVVGAGARCVRWGYPGLVSIVASWVISPVLAGLLSAGMLVALRHGILQAAEPFERALAALPALLGGSTALVVALVLFSARPLAGTPRWALALAVAGAGALPALAAQLVLVPRLRRTLPSAPAAAKAAGGAGRLEMGRSFSVRQEAVQHDAERLSLLPPEPAAGPGSTAGWLTSPTHWRHHSQDGAAAELDSPLRLADEDSAEVLEAASAGSPLEQQPGQSAKSQQLEAAEGVFRYLQVLTACLKSYAHGANDTANAAGPFAAVQALYLHGLDACQRVNTPLWVLAFCGAGIVVGLATWGHKVMQTVGKDITQINFMRGFVIELGSTLSVVLASVVGMPVSSTHCQIGSVVAVGVLESGPGSVQWHVFSKIVVSWLVTVPIAAGAAAALLAMFRFTVT